MKYLTKEFDIAVIGAGPGGLGAAIAAARLGARVLLVDKNGYLGGNLALGLPLLAYLDRDGRRVIGGIAEEFAAELRAYPTAYGRACSEHHRCPLHNSVTLYDHEIFKMVALRKVLGLGIEVLLHTEVRDADVDSGRLTSVLLSGKGYEIRVFAKVFIDGTGDGDLAFLSGASYKKGQADTGVLQPPTLMFTLAGVNTDETIEYIRENPDEMKLSDTTDVDEGYNADYFTKNPEFVMVGLRQLFARLRAEGKLPINRDTIIIIKSLLPGEVHMNCTRHQGTDGSDVLSLTGSEIEGLLQIEKFVEMLHEHVPGFENCYITQIYPSMGIRESRRFEGITELTERDLVEGRIGEDTIAIGSYPVDIHMGDGLSTVFTKLPNYGVPYGITVSREIEGLMFAGRCASMDAVAMSSARVMPICMAMGEAAGIGAALSVKQGISPRDVDVAEIRAIVLEKGGILE